MVEKNNKFIFAFGYYKANIVANNTCSVLIEKILSHPLVTCFIETLLIQAAQLNESRKQSSSVTVAMDVTTYPGQREIRSSAIHFPLTTHLIHKCILSQGKDF